MGGLIFFLLYLDWFCFFLVDVLDFRIEIGCFFLDVGNGEIFLKSVFIVFLLIGFVRNGIEICILGGSLFKFLFLYFVMVLDILLDLLMFFKVFIVCLISFFLWFILFNCFFKMFRCCVFLLFILMFIFLKILFNFLS